VQFEPFNAGLEGLALGLLMGLGRGARSPASVTTHG
jgi:hypothetical protein